MERGGVPGLGIVRLASWLVPASSRASWRAEWTAELSWDWSRRRNAGRAGMGAAAALRVRALSSFRDAWRLGRRAVVAGAVAADVRLALRQFRREPFVHAVIVLTLALGIGANAAIFGVVRSVLMGALPLGEPERVVRVWMRNDARGWLRLDGSLPDFEDLHGSAASFAALAAYNVRDGNLGGLGEAERVEYAVVTPDFFAVMGVSPARGRFLGPADDVRGSNDVIVVSDGFWRTRLGAAGDVVGRTLRLDGSVVTIVGVAPAGFAFPTRRTEVWKPLAMHGLEAGPREGRWLSLIGRLRAGADPSHADAELASLTSRMADEYPASNEGWDAWAEPLHDVAVAGVRTPLLVAWAAVALVLLIAAANIASLQLARTMRREHEIAVRGVLGAGRPAIIRQLLVESVVVALAAGGVGVLFAGAGVRLAARLGETPMQVGRGAAIDGRVLLLTLAVTLVTGVLTGLLPALRGAGDSAAASLRGGGRGTVRGRSRARAGLVAAEVAMAAVILVGAGLLTRSLAALRAVDVGVPLENRLTLRVAPAWPEYPERAQGVAFFRRVEERVRALSDVESVGAVNRLPLEGPWWTGGIVLAGRPAPTSNEQPLALNRVVTPGYIDAAGLRLLRGRRLEEGDDAAAPRVVLVSESLAKRFWPDSDPIGASMAFAPPSDREVEWSTIVGVVSDARYTGLDGAPDDVVYTTLAQARWGHFDDWGMGLLITTRGDPLAVLPGVRDAVAGVDPALPLYDVRTMGGRLGTVLEARADSTRMIAVFAALALLLAAVGTWAVIAFNVSRQAPEIGLRIALGETPGAVLRRILLRGMAPAAAGMTVGLPGAWLGARAIRSQLFGVEPLDLRTFVAATLLLLALSALACWLPARRASRLDPLSALRTE